ncbi:MAG: hypothetical protein ACREQC_00695, partial [Candidatus Binataceae bacterium]
LLGGKLQGLGAPGEIVSIEVRGMEILFEARAGHALAPRLAERAAQTGGRYRVEIPEPELYEILEELRGCLARILSVTPLRPTLEDYFLRLVGQEKAVSHAVEVVR